MKEEGKEKVYLINNSSIENYKSFFEYKELENHLDKIEIKSDIYNTSKFIENIILNLPDDYIKKLKEYNKIEKLNYEYNNIKIDNKEISFLFNFQIINSPIKDKLISLFKYDLTEDAFKRCSLFFIGNEKIFLKFDNNNIDKDLIGYINDENIFCVEYILDYAINNISFTNLQHFLLQLFESDNKNENIKIFDSNNSNLEIGFCYKNNSKLENNPELEQNNILKNLNEKENQINNQLKDSVPNPIEKKKFSKYKKLMEIIILIYKNNRDTKEFIEKSLIPINNTETEKNITYLEGFFIQKEFIDNLKEIYNYEIISKCIEKEDLSDIETNKDKRKNLVEKTQTL